MLCVNIDIEPDDTVNQHLLSGPVITYDNSVKALLICYCSKRASTVPRRLESEEKLEGTQASQK
jgi:hypothetical protein